MEHRKFTRFLHLADLHLGKTLHRYNLLPDQIQTLQFLHGLARERAVDAVLIAGDIYQRSTPAPEAMAAFSTFLAGLAKDGIPCYVISGNHDNATRVAYLSEIVGKSGIHIASAEGAKVDSFSLQDDYGALTLHLLSYCTPMQARKRYPDAQIQSYQDALAAVLARVPYGTGRNVLVAHQFLTGAEICESEELTIGMLENVSAELFHRFDYVALGHLHGAQCVGRDTVRYAGSPLKYSFSEVDQRKSATIVELHEPGNVIIECVPIPQPHAMRILTDSFDVLMQAEPTDDFVRIRLTDLIPPPDAQRSLRGIYHNLMLLEIANGKVQRETFEFHAEEAVRHDFLAMLRDFYAMQNGGASLSERQALLATEILAGIQAQEGDGK